MAHHPARVPATGKVRSFLSSYVRAHRVDFEALREMVQADRLNWVTDDGAPLGGHWYAAMDYGE